MGSTARKPQERGKETGSSHGSRGGRGRAGRFLQFQGRTASRSQQEERTPNRSNGATGDTHNHGEEAREENRDTITHPVRGAASGHVSHWGGRRGGSADRGRGPRGSRGSGVGSSEPRGSRQTLQQAHEVNSQRTSPFAVQRRPPNRQSNPRLFTRKLEQVKDLGSKGAGEILTVISNGTKWFSEVLADPAIREDAEMMRLVVRCLAIAFDMLGLDSTVERAITVAVESKFFYSLASFNQSKLKDFKDSDEAGQVIADQAIVFECILERCPRSCASSIRPAVEAGIFAVRELSRRGIVIEKASANAMALVGNRINKLRDVAQWACEPRDDNPVRRDKRRHRQQNAKDMLGIRPDEDFRSLPVVPSAGELLQAKRPFIHSNITRGQYRDVDHYLDVQFRLMREDFVRPLREGIRSVMRFVTEDGKLKAGHNRVENVSIYEEGSVTDLACDQRGVKMALRFSLRNLKQVKWQETKRLMQGSLLCLTHDGFKTVMFATVADRDPREMSKGVVMIRPESHRDNLETWTGKKFLVIESEAFFEAYRHFLSCLQMIRLDQYPLKKYIVDVEKKIVLPAYYTAGWKGEASAAIPLSHMSAKPGVELHADPIRGSWPTPQLLNLDEAQFRAFAAGLTREFAIIQGPPGTGKTFIGLKKVKTILERRRLSKLNNEGPILVVCLTNHALDQFLEGMEVFTKNILRMGSRSSSEKLKPYLLPSVRERLREEAKSRGVSGSQQYFSMVLRKQMRAILESIEFDRTVRDALSSGNGVLNAEVIRAIDPKIWMPANFSVARWLGLDATASDGGSSAWESTDQSVHQTSQQGRDSLQSLLAAMKIDDDDEEQGESEVGRAQNPTAADVEIEEVETLQQRLRDLELYYDEDVAPIRVSGAEANKVFRAVFETSDRQLRKQMYQAGDQLDALDKQNAEMEARLNSDDEALSEEEFETWRVMYQRNRYQAEKDGQIAKAALKTLTGARRYLRVPRSFDLKRPAEVPADGNIMNLSYLSRWLLYRYWANQHARAREAAMKKEIVKCDALAPRLDEARSIELLDLVKKMDVVGMTTTRAAMNFTVVQNMKAKVVIVEEAAEVLECHIVCCLSRYCEHLILIGDHQQLRPSPTVYNLATDHNFDVSLFERMLNNGMPYERLRTQHRMRPEIAQLLKPHIYQDLEDHQAVVDRENIRGVEKNVFFVTHNHQEDSNADLKSKSNKKEAHFLLAMCQYLLLQGYKDSEITILMGYSGQSIVIKNLLSLYPACKNVSITLVDSFQGEENRIILLSLVRSNEEGKIGFLKTENRVNVALSRAKEGLFIVGNMDSLCADPRSIWRKIRVVLEKQEALGRGLPLRCENHPDQTMIASAPEQFPATGGCSKVCNVPLKCGHLCQNRCHVSDLEHLTRVNACRRPCGRICAAGKHRCRGVCGQDPCPACKDIVTRILPACKHQQAMFCTDDPSKVSCGKLCNAKISCGHACTRVCHSQDDDQHKLYHCEEPCEKECPQHHKCRGRCGDSTCPPCVEKVLKQLPCGHKGQVMCHMHASARVSCMEKCRQILACGHPCKRRCNEKCGGCDVSGEKYIVGCSHKVTVPCGIEALQIHCRHCKEKCDPGVGPAELDRERGSPRQVHSSECTLL